MSCVRSSGGVGARDPSSGLGSSSSTYSSSICSLKGELEKGSRISSGWTEKSTGESRATTRGSGVATEEDERQDHNTDTPFEFRYSQENNKALTEAQVCYAHVVEEE